MKQVTLLLSALLTLGLGVSAQKSGKEIKGDKFFKQYYFQGAIDKYVGVDGLTVGGQRNLAESYHNTNQNELSEEAYSKFVNSSEVTPEDLFNYASVLRLNGNYADSDQWMKKFQVAAPADLRAKSYASNAGELDNLLKDEGRYSITHLDINSEQTDFGTAFYGKQIVFASSREGVKGIKRKYNWNGMPFLDLYFADVESDQLTNPLELTRKINDKMHEGPASFTADQKMMAFTKNNYDEKSEDGTVKLQLYFSTKDENGGWGKEESFKLNNKEYNVGHPWLSADGKAMYFSSDMPGGFGGSDIYRITKSEDGSWEEAVNLGEGINTEGSEVFPFYQEEQGVLFFSSNGHLGLGGLDVFLSPDAGEGEFSKVLNAGTPLNTKADDFSLIVDEKMRKGYFSSNREGGKGDDDIYAFELLKPFTFGKLIKGTAKDTKGNILAGTKVSLYDVEGNVVETVTTTVDGAYQFTVEPNLEFTLDGTKDKYFDGKNTASTKTDEDEIIADLTLEKDPGLSLLALVTDKKTGLPLPGVTMTILDNMTNESVEYTTPEGGDYFRPLADKKLNDRGSYNITLSKEGYFSKTVTYNEQFTKPGKYEVHANLDLGLDPEVKDLAEMIQINPINFDYNKYNIRTDAAAELDKIVEVMNKYPGMEVELGSHTDSRGSDKYNEKLSDRRAKASAAYIKKHIANPDRIYGKGYGEVKIINKCVNGVKCTDEEHETNRRTEFKVIKTGNDNIKVNNTSTDSFEK